MGYNWSFGGVMGMTGVRLLVGVGDPPSVFFGMKRLIHDFFFILVVVCKEVVDWDCVSWCGVRGFGVELLERDGIDIVGRSGSQLVGVRLCLPILFAKLY